VTFKFISNCTCIFKSRHLFQDSIQNVLIFSIHFDMYFCSSIEKQPTEGCIGCGCSYGRERTTMWRWCL